MVEKNQTENTDLEKITNPLLEVSRDITQHRLRTTTNGFHEYRKQQERLLFQIEEDINKDNGCCLTKGIHYEALFYSALANRYQQDNYFRYPNISISTGDEDRRGIDFIISTKSNKFPVDVTVNYVGYPKKMGNLNSLSIMLPKTDPDTGKEYLSYFERYILDSDLEDFLQKLFYLNMAILNNSHPNHEIFVKKRKGKKLFKAKIRRDFKEKQLGLGNYEEQHKIYIKQSVYQNTMDLLSLINNTN